MTEDKNKYILSINGMSKSFGRNKVLKHISMNVKPGTIMGLMGENGAGKSTMMKCLFGTYQKDEGTIVLDGKEVNFSGPKDALENGVAMVHQELNQCLERSVVDNMFLGRYPKNSFGVVDEGRMKKETSDLFRKLGITVDLTQPMKKMSVSQRQMCEIAKAISYHSKVIVLDEPMLNDFIEKVVIHEAEGGRTKDRTQQVDIYFNFIGNFVLPLSEDEVEALQSEEARRAEEIAERKRKSSKKSTQKRNQKRAEIKAKAEAGDPEAMAEYKAVLEKGRQNNRKRAEKMRELRMSDPEYRAKMEEKERLALEREKKRQERATKKKKIALAELKEQAEKGNQEAVRELEERRAIARERSRKSAEKRKQRAENDPEYAKYLEERNAEYNRRHTARRKEQMEALRARAEAGDQEAQSQLAERKQYQVRATVKSYRKMRDDALSGDPIAKVRYEKTLAMRREAYHAKKSEQTA